MRLKGRLFDGETSTSHEAILYFDEHGNIESNLDFLSTAIFKDVTISNRVGNTPRTITFPNGEIFETVEHDDLNRIVEQYGGRESWVHILESNTRYVVCALIFLVAFLVWGSIWGVPWLSTQVAYALPAKVNVYIAHGTLETLDDRVFEESTLNEERKLELRNSFSELLPENKEDYNYNLVFRAGGFIGANAFALPDGTIVVTDELVKLANHDEEIISVLLHEIGHVEYRHSLRNILSHAGLTALVLTVTGDVNSAGTLVLALPNVLLESSYSRDLEWEADTYSLAYMQKHNIDTEHFANFMERMDNYAYEFDDEGIETNTADNECPVDNNMDISDITGEEKADDAIETDNEEEKVSTDLGWLNYISSHPPSEERIERFRNKTE